MVPVCLHDAVVLFIFFIRFTFLVRPPKSQELNEVMHICVFLYYLLVCRGRIYLCCAAHTEGEMDSWAGGGVEGKAIQPQLCITCVCLCVCVSLLWMLFRHIYNIKGRSLLKWTEWVQPSPLWHRLAPELCMSAAQAWLMCHFTSDWTIRENTEKMEHGSLSHLVMSFYKIPNNN